MALFEWTDKYSVGVSRFNNHHKQLFELMNALHDSVRKGHSRAILDESFDRMLNYTEVHFAEEEASLAMIRYPTLDYHRREHDGLRSQLRDFKTRYEKGEAVLGIDLLNFLLRWWTEHILRTDREYASYFFAHKDVPVLK